MRLIDSHVLVYYYIEEEVVIQISLWWALTGYSAQGFGGGHQSTLVCKAIVCLNAQLRLQFVVNSHSRRLLLLSPFWPARSCSNASSPCIPGKFPFPEIFPGTCLANSIPLEWRCYTRESAGPRTGVHCIFGRSGLSEHAGSDIDIRHRLERDEHVGAALGLPNIHLSHCRVARSMPTIPMLARRHRQVTTELVCAHHHPLQSTTDRRQFASNFEAACHD